MYTVSLGQRLNEADVGEDVKPAVALQVDIATPEIFIGGLLGAMLVFLFSAWACLAVGRSAQAVVNEVRLCLGAD